MSVLRHFLKRIRTPVDLARALVEGSANQSRLLNDKSNAIIEGIDNQSKMLNSKLDAIISALNKQSRTLNAKLDVLVSAMDDQSRLLNPNFQPANRAPTIPEASVVDNATLGFASDGLPPLLVAEKTYNTSHPDYDATVVRNFPGKIINGELPCHNSVYAELKKLATDNSVPDEAWKPLLQETLTEVKTVSHSALVLQRRDALEQYMADISRRYSSRYMAGSVNFDDALFLYWLVRRLKPRTIVQCGVCNGLSSAFMVLALAKNGADGQLFAIDLPPVFNPKDPSWTISGKTYGIVIPEGKTSGWMVPEAYRKRFEVQSGDSKLLLPQLIDRLSTIDMFFHDSDHNYNHMMFEFREAKRKLAAGGVIVADDISWNAAIWDFADTNRAPGYNFKGAVGVAFF